MSFLAINRSFKYALLPIPKAIENRGFYCVNILNLSKKMFDIHQTYNVIEDNISKPWANYYLLFFLNPNN